MPPTFETDYANLISQIKEMATETDTLVRTRRVVETIMNALQQLREGIKKNGFNDEAEEITFYKYTKPKFHALYIYYASIFNVESDKPLGTKKATQKYFRNELRRIDNFWQHNLDLYKYYRSGYTHLDKEYFTRGHGFNGLWIDIVTPIMDPDFCTLHSIKISFLIAYQDLRDYFQNAMLEIETPFSNPVFGPGPEPLIWTDTKVGLVELAYSLHAKGSFNHGQATLTQITDNLEKEWHVKLGNTSSAFQDILSRGKGVTVFLDKLIKALIKRMRED